MATEEEQGTAASENHSIGETGKGKKEKEEEEKEIVGGCAPARPKKRLIFHFWRFGSHRERRKSLGRRI